VSVKTTRRILWLALVVVLPVPYWVMESGRVPSLWLLELTGFALAMLMTEGGMVPQIVSGLFAGQALLSVGACWLVAWLATRVLYSAVPPEWQKRGVLAAVVLLFVSSLLRIYATPLVSGGSPVNLIELFA